MARAAGPPAKRDEGGGLGSGSSPVRLFVSVPQNEINWVIEVGAQIQR